MYAAAVCAAAETVRRSGSGPSRDPIAACLKRLARGRVPSRSPLRLASHRAHRTCVPERPPGALRARFVYERRARRGAPPRAHASLCAYYRQGSETTKRPPVGLAASLPDATCLAPCGRCGVLEADRAKTIPISISMYPQASDISRQRPAHTKENTRAERRNSATCVESMI